MSSDRDRLIKLLYFKQYYGMSRKFSETQVSNEEVADYLIANGVIIPPCKVGDKVWILLAVEKTIESREISTILRRQKSWTMTFTNGDCFTVWDNAEDNYFGKTVFLTREEAEKALERSKGNAEEKE